jgi:parallel beta-helix repeat protein
MSYINPVTQLNPSAAYDNAPRIQAALDACARLGGGVVVLPPGTYYTSVLAMTANGVHLKGSGTTLVLTSYTSTLITLNASQCAISDLTLDGSYVSGAITLDTGIITVYGDTATTADNVIRDCWLQNGYVAGIRTYGLVSDLTIDRCAVTNCFQAVTSNSSAYGIPQRHTITRCRMTNGHHDGAASPSWLYSAGVKFSRNSGLHAMEGYGHQIRGNTILNCGEMGVELWGFSGHDSIVDDNIIEDTAFGISVNNASRVVVSNNKLKRQTFIGIELADAATYCSVTDNICYQYDSGGARIAASAIVTSGAGNAHNHIADNFVTGCYANAIHIISGDYYTVVHNTVSDCAVGIYFQASQHVTADGNILECTGSHLWLDFDNGIGAASYTDFVVSNNVLRGDVSYANMVIYDGGHLCTASNISIVNNDFSGADHSNYSINNTMAAVYTPNYVVAGNRSNPVGSIVDDYTTQDVVDSNTSANIKAGIDYNRRGTISVTADAVNTRWYKIWSRNEGRPIALRLKIWTAISGQNQRDAEFYIYSNPYSNETGIVRQICGFYDATTLDQVIINNDGGATHEVWIKVLPAAQSYTVDYWLSYPGLINEPVAPTNLVTAEPAWNSNVYQSASQVVNSFMHLPGVHAQRGLYSSLDGTLAWEPKARLWIRGPQPSNWGSQTPVVARFEDASGNLVLQVRQDGMTEAYRATFSDSVSATHFDVGGNQIVAGRGAAITAAPTSASTNSDGAVSAGADSVSLSDLNAKLNALRLLLNQVSGSVNAVGTAVNTVRTRLSDHGLISP